MTCSCCETGRCCNFATCTAGTVSECVHRSGTFTAGGDCGTKVCLSLAPYDQPCTLTNACDCAASGKNTVSMATPTCDCATLASLGFIHGGCKASQKCCGASGCLDRAQTTFTVNVAENVWVSTGVTLVAGGQVSIQADGYCDRCAGGTVEWAGVGSTATPDGVTSAPCNCSPSPCSYDSFSVSPAFCHMALIGKVGSGGTPFLVGRIYTGSPGAGLLYLRQNDTNIDNRGFYTGTLAYDPCPGYTPASVGEPIVYAAGEEPPQPGPGAALKSLLRLAGIVASPTCSCNARAAQMDAWGEWECLKRLPEITGWLKEEAEKRDLWFFPPAGAALILAAISLSALKRPFRGINR